MSAAYIALGVVLTLVAQGLWAEWRAPRIKCEADGHWRFPVDTLEQMLAIPVERRERFLAELPNMLRRIWDLKDKFPLQTLPGAVWVDDGRGEFRPNVLNSPTAAQGEFATRSLDGGVGA